MTRSVFFILCLLIFNGFDVCSSQSTVTVYFNTSVLTVVEGDYIDIQLVAQGTFSKSFTVNLNFTDRTARYFVDYFYNPGIIPSVTFTPGSISSSVFRASAFSNNKWEGTKSFEVGFDLTPGQNLDCGSQPDTLRVNIEDDDSVHISFQESIQTVREDLNSVPIWLQSRGLYGRRFSLSFACIEFHPVEAKDGDDFTGGVYTVEFETFDQYSTLSSMVEIPILDNLISEHTEAFFCVILRPRGVHGIVVEDSSTITLVIEDDDFHVVSFEMAVYSGEEGGILSDIRLKARRPVKRPFTVQIIATTLDASRPEKDNEATSGVDYIDPRSLPGGGVVLFNPALGAISSPLTIPLLSDNSTECTEYFGLRFVVLSNQEDLGIIPVEPTMAVVAINDTNGECPKPVPVSPRPTVIAPVPPEKCTRGSVSSATVHFKTSTLTVDEGSNNDIQLVAQGRFCKNISVNLTFTDGTASYLWDYFYAPSIKPSVTFTPGSISSSVFRVIAISNNIWEGTNFFEVGFVLPSDPNLTSGKPDTLRVNIVDDDSVHISFQNSTQTVREDSGSVPLRLQSHGVYGTRFSVSFRCIEFFPVEAKDGEDFTGGVYTVEFQNLGDDSTLSSAADIPIVDDFMPEPTKVFICVILRQRGGGIVVEDPSTITVVIEDSGSVCTIACENGGTCSAPNICTCAIGWTGSICTTAICTPGCQNGGTCSSPGVCTCASEWSGACCTDPVCSPGCSNGGTCIAPSTCACTPQWTGSTCTTDINECTMGTHDCSQTCTNADGSFQCGCFIGYKLQGRNKCVDINECTMGTHDCSQTCTNADGSFQCGCFTGYKLQGRNKCVDIDECARGEHECTQKCHNTPGGYYCYCDLGYHLAKNGLDCERDGVHISFRTPSLTVRENSTSVRLQLQSSGVYGRRFSVSFTCIPVFPVEAKDGNDFKGGAYTVEFGENQTVSSTAEIAIVDDSLPECTESFICVILRPTGGIGIVGGEPNTITVVIEDDDPPFVQFVDASVAGVEKTFVNLIVNRSRTITKKLKCTVHTESTTAIAGDDYRLLTNFIEFKRRNAAFEEKSIHLQLLKDKLVEAEECFSVVLDCRPKDLTGCYPPSATVCIQEN